MASPMLSKVYDFLASFSTTPNYIMFFPWAFFRPGSCGCLSFDHGTNSGRQGNVTATTRMFQSNTAARIYTRSAVYLKLKRNIGQRQDTSIGGTKMRTTVYVDVQQIIVSSNRRMYECTPKRETRQRGRLKSTPEHLGLPPISILEIRSSAVL